MPEQSLKYDARHAVTVIYSAPVSKYRFVSWAGAHATDAAEVQGISELAGAAGKAGSVVTAYSYLVEAAGVIPVGSAVAPSSDGTGRAVVATGLQCGRANSAAAAAGELVEVLVRLLGGGLSPAKAVASDALVSGAWNSANSGTWLPLKFSAIARLIVSGGASGGTYAYSVRNAALTVTAEPAASVAASATDVALIVTDDNLEIQVTVTGTATAEIH